MRQLLVFSFLMLLPVSVHAADEPMPDSDGFISLFDGKTLDGWKAAENPNCAKVVAGAIVVGGGPRGHLFYDGPVKNHDFKNFEFKARVKCLANSNSGIYFHTQFQDKNWPSQGFEAQICSDKYNDPKKTGSLYGVKNLDVSPVKDDEWFDYQIIVNGRDITLKINGKTTAEYTEVEGKLPNATMPGRTLASGTFALQGHDPQSFVHFKDLRVKPLAD